MVLNKKGQSLVMFVLIIPIILFILILVYDVSNALLEKNKLSNTCYLATQYALDNSESIDENDVINYVMKNSDNLSNLVVIIKDDTVSVEISKSFSGIFEFDLIDIKAKYIGTIIEGEKNIERIK